IRPAATCIVPRTQLLAASRRHVAASYWTAVSDVAPTSAPVSASQRRRRPVNGGGSRWYQSGSGYHDVPLPYTETFMLPKPDLVFNNAPNEVETDHPTFNVKLSLTKHDNDLSHTLRPSTPIIEDWVSDSEDESETKTPHNSKLVPITAVRTISTSVPKTSVTRPRQAKTIITKPNSPPRRHINHSSSPKASTFPLKVTAIKAPMVNAAQGNLQHALKHKGVNDSGCSRHMIGNMSYLSDFKELNGRYVTFGGNPKGGKIFGKGLENQLSLKVKVIRSDNGIKLKNNDLNQFCGMKEIKREFSVPRTPQQNGIVERKNRTLVEAARTMLADSLLPILFWAEAVNTACYVQNRVLVTKPQNKTPYELLHGRTPSIGFMRPFDCPVTILNTLDSLGKFDGKGDEGFLVGYSVSSKAFRVFNSRTRIVQETLHVNFIENKPNVSGVQEQFDAEKAREENIEQYMLFPIWSSGSTNPHNTDGDAAFNEKELEFEGRKPESKVNVSPSSSAPSKKHDDKTKREAKGKSPIESLTKYRNLSAKFKDFSDNSINEDNAAGTLVPAVGQVSPNNTNTFSATGPSNVAASPTHGKSSCIDTSQLPDDIDMPKLEDITYSDDKDTVGAEADFKNLETSITVSLIPTTRLHKDHPVIQIIGDISLATQTRSMTRVARDQEPKRVHQAFKDPSWIEAMQEELLQFKMPKVWVLVYLPHEKRAIGTKWGFRNKKDERGIVVRNKAQLVAQGHTQEEGIDYEEVFAPEEVYVCQPPGFEDPDYPDKVYKVVKKDGIFISHDKYVAEILRKFGLQDGKSANPIDTKKPLLKDPDVTSKASHLHAVKGIFRYLKGKPHLGLWYPKDSPFDLVAYSDSDYAGASLDKKSTTRGCQFLGCRLIFWKCKKQTVVTTLSIEAEYVAAASCCVVQSGMESLKRMLRVTNILSTGSLTTPQMVLNSPCLTHIKNWLVQIKQCLLASPKANDSRTNGNW
nr:retrovirus-related Pol polyprotein from transposon TNT 1-94 [Tanacetum cinerariifolium]